MQKTLFKCFIFQCYVNLKRTQQKLVEPLLVLKPALHQPLQALTEVHLSISNGPHFQHLNKYGHIDKKKLGPNFVAWKLHWFSKVPWDLPFLFVRAASSLDKRSYYIKTSQLAKFQRKLERGKTNLYYLHQKHKYFFTK